MGTRKPEEEGLDKCKACRHCSLGSHWCSPGPSILLPRSVTGAPCIYLPSLHSALCLQEEVHGPESSRGPGRKLRITLTSRIWERSSEQAPVILSAPNAINGHKIIHSFLEAGPMVCLNGTIKLHAEMIWKRRGRPSRAGVK